MNLRDELAAILREHQKDGKLPYCTGCGLRLIADHASHVADLQIAYLRDNLAEHTDELGMTRDESAREALSEVRDLHADWESRGVLDPDAWQLLDDLAEHIYPEDELT